MTHTNNSKSTSEIRPFSGRLFSALRWLAKPADSLPETLIQDSVLLGWTLILVITLSLLALAALIATPASTPQLIGFIILVLSAVFIFMVALILNRMGHYRLSAVLTIFGAVVAPWGTAIVDPVVLQGDLIPLTYVVIPVLLSSILLPPVITALVAGIQITALAYVLSLMPVSANINWISFLNFTIIASAISTLTSIIRLRDQKQIAHQRRLLVESEAKLREESIRDHLTGLFNRRYLDETLDREIRRAKRAAIPVGVIMMDIDHFKHLNDKFGHAAGDIVLQEVSKLLISKIRYADIVCRYGGEEFVIVMPEASLETTHRRAENLRMEVKGLELFFKNQNLGSITLSSGVAVFPDHGVTGQAVLQSADTALYAAKRSGRDRVVIAS